MPLGESVCESRIQTRHVYFPTTCIVSLIYVMADGASAEIAVVGNEGLQPLPHGGGALRPLAASKEELASSKFQIFSPDNMTSQRPLGDGAVWVRKVQLHSLFSLGLRPRTASPPGSMPFRNLNRSLSVDRTSVVFSSMMDL